MCIYVPFELNPIVSDVLGARRGASEASEPCTSEASCDTGTLIGGSGHVANRCSVAGSSSRVE